MLQVLRTLLTPVYGWSAKSVEVARWIDIVYIGDILVLAIPASPDLHSTGVKASQPKAAYRRTCAAAVPTNEVREVTPAPIRRCPQRSRGCRCSWQPSSSSSLRLQTPSIAPASSAPARSAAAGPLLSTAGFRKTAQSAQPQVKKREMGAGC